MKRLFKNTFLIVCLSFCCFFLKTNSTFADGVKYSSSDISVIVEKNGNAHITEVWKIDANEGTEMYLGKEDLQEQTISNLRVTENGREYQNIGTWNTNESLQNKAYKSGIIKKPTGYELCWGLSSYGEHNFTVSYDMTNLAKECADGSFIYQTFIRNLADSLDEAKITIEQEDTKFTKEDTKIWAGGGAFGEIFVTDGKIVASTTSPMDAGANFVILAQFDKGIFSPAVFVNTTFGELKDNALKGSDYQKNYDRAQGRSDSQSNGNSFWRFTPALIPFIIVFISRALFLKTKRRNDNIVIHNDHFRKEYKNPEYSRSLPFENNLFATYTRLKNLSQLESDFDIIGVYLLKWIQSHRVDLVKVESKKLLKKDLENAIKFKTLKDDAAPQLEKELFDIMTSAANKDKILRKKDFEKWCKNNFDTIESWLGRYNKFGFEELKNMGAVNVHEKKSFGLFKYTQNDISQLGIKYTSEMFGFKKYLKDFTVINEREVKEVELWDEYLVYAQIFGIAKEVSKQFKDLYPQYFEERFSFDYMMDNYLMFLLINELARSYAHSVQNVYNQRFNTLAGEAFSGLGGSFGGTGGFGGSSGGGGSSGVR
ncbi:MAG: hypothetical protein RUMPE_01290 [Eubacteriales bacterium SKADARSKE-1]|nr:hypothetical protein [Eubacteriales bacterium SKADARSKE-1]